MSGQSNRPEIPRLIIESLLLTLLGYHVVKLTSIAEDLARLDQQVQMLVQQQVAITGNDRALTDIQARMRAVEEWIKRENERNDR